MAKLGEKHYKYLRNQEFLDEYVRELENRITYSNNKLEEDGLEINEFYAAEHIDTLRDNLKAFELILDKIKFIYDLYEAFKKETDMEKKKKISYHIKNNRNLTEDFIIEIANNINKHAPYISQNYRTIDNGVKFGEKYPIENAANIKTKMAELLDNYYGAWSELDVFEKEAKFNIEFLRIHPFDDGNGRTSRLLLNYNLLLQGHAPIVFPANVKEDYFDARNKENVNWIKDLFEKESEKELKVLDKLIEEYEEEKEKEKLL